VDEYMNEQEQWDYVRTWVRQNGPWVVAGVALAAAGLWGWKAWQAHREAGLLAASSQYEQLVTAFSKNDRATVVTLADKLVAEHPHTGYAEQAQLAAARMEVENSELPAALARLQRVAAGTADAELALIVRLRIARLQIEQHQADAALATLGSGEAGAFAGRYAEVRGDALLSKGDRAGALKAYREAQAAQAAQAAGPSGDDLLTLKINALTRS
jgi:predicted negative regulator of RcsB-dependent stress response